MGTEHYTFSNQGVRWRSGQDPSQALKLTIILPRSLIARAIRRHCMSLFHLPIKKKLHASHAMDNKTQLIIVCTYLSLTCRYPMSKYTHGANKLPHYEECHKPISKWL